MQLLDINIRQGTVSRMQFRHVSEASQLALLKLRAPAWNKLRFPLTNKGEFHEIHGYRQENGWRMEQGKVDWPKASAKAQGNLGDTHPATIIRFDPGLGDVQFGD